jgi:NAD(P)-dependent dehydrogenase (short-subunit alcohol dehydrogenase family)
MRIKTRTSRAAPSKSRPATARPLIEPKPRFPAQKQRAPGLESRLNPQPRWRGERYRPANKLQGQVALITGGDSGIGRAVAFFYAREGADVAITCLPVEKSDAEETRQAIEALGRKCVVYAGDLRNRKFCDGLVGRTIKDLGGLDILVHNAAAQSRKKIEDLTEEDLDDTLKVNVYAFLRLARAAVPKLKPGSSIIATGSIVGLRGSKKLSDYGATKGAIHTVCMGLAEELIDKQIRVNCVAAGPVWTPLNPSDKGLKASEVATFGKQTGHSPLERPAQPEEIAPAFVFLASNADSSYINGVVLPVTGGPE